MALIGKSIPNLINGVSQQPPEVRLPSQCQEQVNMYPTVAKGLLRRPGTRHLAKILDGHPAGSFVHVYSRDKYEKYIVVVSNGDIKVFDFKGVERTVHKPQGVAYLTCPSPASDIKATTVADNTFILNKTQVARMYDPSEGLTMTPVTQEHTRIEFADLPVKVVTYRSGGIIKRTFTLTSLYSVTVNGKTYSADATTITLSGFMSMVAAKVSVDLNRQCVIEGMNVYIPKEPGDSITVQDDSYYWVLTTEWDWSVTPPTSYITPVKTYQKVTTLSTSQRVVGYASPDGNKIPEADLQHKEGLVFIRLGDYGTTYSISVDDVVVASFTTGTTDRNLISTTYIAQALYDRCVAANLNDIALSLRGNVIRFKATTLERDFKLSVTDSSGDKAMKACKGLVQEFTDLPAQGFDGFTIKVAGDDGVEADDYYVAYTETNSTGEKTTGSWKEVRRKGLNARPAPMTMPHRLISNADGTFTFEPVPWSARTAGDEVSAPDPSFINQNISDVFFYKNRLGLLAGENIIFSEDGEYFMFYPSTVIQSLDTHPIDIAVTNDSVSILRYAVPFNESLLLFADTTQFIISPDNGLTRESISVDVTTRFDASLDAKPVGAGRNVFFAVKNGPCTGVREFYVDPDAKMNDAADITGHCPSYIRGTTRLLAASSNEDVVSCVTDYRPDCIYQYKYYWQGNEKAQSSWGRWEVGGDVLGLAYLESVLVLAVMRGGALYLEKIPLVNDEETKARLFQTDIHLDRRVFVDAGAHIPYTSTALVAIDRSGKVYEGETLSNVITDGVATVPLFVGERFRSYFEFSPLVLSEGDSRVAPLVGKMQLRSMTVKYVDTGFFRTGFQAAQRDPYYTEYSGRRIGAGNAPLGFVPIDSGKYRFPILGNADSVTVWLESTSHLPCAFLAAEWEAIYHRNSRRI